MSLTHGYYTIIGGNSCFCQNKLDEITLIPEGASKVQQSRNNLFIETTNCNTVNANQIFWKALVVNKAYRKSKYTERR